MVVIVGTVLIVVERLQQIISRYKFRRVKGWCLQKISSKRNWSQFNLQRKLILQRIDRKLYLFRRKERKILSCYIGKKKSFLLSSVTENFPGLDNRKHCKEEDINRVTKEHHSKLGKEIENINFRVNLSSFCKIVLRKYTQRHTQFIVVRPSSQMKDQQSGNYCDCNQYQNSTTVGLEGDTVIQQVRSHDTDSTCKLTLILTSQTGV